MEKTVDIEKIKIFDSTTFTLFVDVFKVVEIRFLVRKREELKLIYCFHYIPWYQK